MTLLRSRGPLIIVTLQDADSVSETMEAEPCTPDKLEQPEPAMASKQHTVPTHKTDLTSTPEDQSHLETRREVTPPQTLQQRAAHKVWWKQFGQEMYQEHTGRSVDGCQHPLRSSSRHHGHGSLLVPGSKWLKIMIMMEQKALGLDGARSHHHRERDITTCEQDNSGETVPTDDMDAATEPGPEDDPRVVRLSHLLVPPTLMSLQSEPSPSVAPSTKHTRSASE